MAVKVVATDFDVPNAMELDEELHIKEICNRVKCEDEFKLRKFSILACITNNS
jgi:hypothetical protein